MNVGAFAMWNLYKEAGILYVVYTHDLSQLSSPVIAYICYLFIGVHVVAATL